MTDIRSFKKKWVDFVVEREKGFSGIQTTEQFENEIRTCIDTLVDSIAGQIAAGKFHNFDADRSKQYIMKNNDGVFGPKGSLYRALRHYRSCHNWLHEILTVRAQEDWATTWDHVKNFIYKTITAITFAAIVLGTAYIANQLGILIPTIRFGV